MGRKAPAKRKYCCYCKRTHLAFDDAPAEMKPIILTSAKLKQAIKDRAS
jgi:hypothetical protein